MSEPTGHVVAVSQELTETINTMKQAATGHRNYIITFTCTYLTQGN